jgi:hypothetical protein
VALVISVFPTDGTLQLGHIPFDEFPERFAYLLLNERQESEVDEAELILRPETPPSFCPVDRERFESSEVVLKESLNVICGNALPIFRSLSSLLPPLKRVLKTNED